MSAPDRRFFTVLKIDAFGPFTLMAYMVPKDHASLPGQCSLIPGCQKRISTFQKRFNHINGLSCHNNTLDAEERFLSVPSAWRNHQKSSCLLSFKEYFDELQLEKRVSFS
jgi:hypothetical protein